MPVKNTFLICTRDVDDNQQFVPEPGETRFLRVPMAKRAYGAAEAISRERWTKAVIAAADGVEDEITGSTGRHSFLRSWIQQRYRDGSLANQNLAGVAFGAGMEGAGGWVRLAQRQFHAELS